MTDLDQQLDALTDDQVLDAINRRAQRKGNADAAAAQSRSDERRRASNDLMRAEVKRRFGKDLPASDSTANLDAQVQEPTSGYAEAARRFPKGT